MFLAHKIELRPTKEQEQRLMLLLIYKVWTGSSRTIIAWKSSVRLLAAWALTTGILVLTKLRTDKSVKKSFAPDYAIHPGKILEETLEARGIKKNELAKRCGLAPKTVSQIINGKASISPAIAIKLERAIGVSASLWTNLASDYNKSLE